MLAGSRARSPRRDLQSGVTVIGVGMELDAIAAVVIGGTLLTGGAGIDLRHPRRRPASAASSPNLINQIGGLDSNFQPVISGALLLLVVVAQRLLARTRATPRT